MYQEEPVFEVLPVCCLTDCLNTIPIQEREVFRKKFSLCKTSESQCIFLISHVDETPLNEAVVRKFTRSYRIGPTQVCQRSFCEILEISKSRVRDALKKFREGCLESKSKRVGGNHKIPENIKDLIVNHINTFPPFLTHYRWKKSEPKFAKSELAMRTMYRLFANSWRANCSEEVKPPSESTYKKVFDSLGLNIREFRSDKCPTCSDLKRRIEDADGEFRKTLEEELDEHFNEATTLQEQITFDFEPIEKKQKKLKTFLLKPDSTFTCDVCGLSVDGKMAIRVHLHDHIRQRNNLQKQQHFQQRQQKIQLELQNYQLRKQQFQAQCLGNKEEKTTCDICGIRLANETTWAEHVKLHFHNKSLPATSRRFKQYASRTNSTETVVSRFVVRKTEQVFIKQTVPPLTPQFKKVALKTEDNKTVVSELNVLPTGRILLKKALTALLPRCSEGDSETDDVKPAASRTGVSTVPAIVQLCDKCGGETLTEAMQARAVKTWPCFLCDKVFRLGGQFWKHNRICHADA